ncbi:uncharacterized protein MP3633_3444 [Marinomonas primoryensis]|uniref:Uncharacterized protein n=1 Tax=Marinomonas primoryensis TaxID=178399 RepID=A0A859D593_9GAMM|nr:uncharacterized protein MP3633_3444 [Marinomonas primoryensis]
MLPTNTAIILPTNVAQFDSAFWALVTLKHNLKQCIRHKKALALSLLGDNNEGS